MTFKTIWQSGFQTGRHSIKIIELAFRIVILIETVSRSKMREHRTHGNMLVIFQKTKQLVNLVVDKAKTVHARVEFDMDRIVFHSVTPSLVDKHLQFTSREHSRFEPITKQGLIISRHRVKHHNRHCNTGTAQCDAFFNHCHCEICSSVALKCFSKFESTRSITGSLDHYDHFGRRSQQ